MNKRCSSRDQLYVSPSRLVFKEIVEIKKGLSKYCGRASLLTRDFKSCKSVAKKIARHERNLQQILNALENEVNTHA